MEDEIRHLVEALWTLEDEIRGLRQLLIKPPVWLVSPQIVVSQAGEEEEEEEEE